VSENVQERKLHRKYALSSPQDLAPYKTTKAIAPRIAPMSAVLRCRPSAAPDFGAAVLLVCAGPLELLDGPLALLVLAVVDTVVLVEFAVVDVASVLLLTRVSEDVSVVMAVGRVVFADAGMVAIGVTAVSVVVVLA
jgi:hypothetical protein